MQEHESIEEIFARFIIIVNELNALGEKSHYHNRSQEYEDSSYG